MTVTVKVIEDSISLDGHRLTSLQLHYPRFIHSELMTYRAFSRNASSSRAIPVERVIQAVLDDTAMPVRWGANKPGMQDGGLCVNPVQFSPVGEHQGIEGTAAQAWLAARDHAVQSARAFSKAGYHKQVVNRLLEPFAHIDVIVTASDWSNFFRQRCGESSGADPTMGLLADTIKVALENGQPVRRSLHLPYVSEEERLTLKAKDLFMISAARCARVSYLNHDQTAPVLEKDLELARRLWADEHLSPFEHPARASGVMYSDSWANFVGWTQVRHMDWKV